MAEFENPQGAVEEPSPTAPAPEAQPSPPEPPAAPDPSPQPHVAPDAAPKPSEPSQAPSPEEVEVPDRDYDPVEAMHARMAAQREAELEAAKQQNYYSALASERAVEEFNASESARVHEQHAYVAGLNRLPSDQAVEVERQRMAAEQEGGNEDVDRLGPPAYAREAGDE